MMSVCISVCAYVCISSSAQTNGSNNLKFCMWATYYLQLCTSPFDSNRITGNDKCYCQFNKISVPLFLNQKLVLKFELISITYVLNVLKIILYYNINIMQK